ncbi:MAG: proton-translocating NADH-quinone oxidoreductase, chain, partial [Acidimicrobiaceae bacterium]|nr:proton-translocating NADH-quinone oxidoreductase, chain [Acidimicrobiaceae bacterium]
MIHAAFLIPLLPLAGFAVLVPFGRRLGNPWAGWFATAMVFASFVVTILVFAGLFQHAPADRAFTQHWFTWFQVDRLKVNAGLYVDPLSMTMAAFVTGVSTLIHLYSIGYMQHDRDFSKFFVYLNLFVFSMLMLVLADNFVLSFLGWEGVGVCSYFLIAFWFERPAAASAGKKAMIYNRIGDAGFLLAIFLIFERTGSVEYTTVFSRLGHVPTSSLIAIGLLLFLGAAGKSAQIPLFPWLADAMEGPTPVSALIHAATMVTAGVYLMCRINPILHAAPDAAHVVAWVGAITAFVAASIGCAQNDIKKVLAYSTVSQLGYMFLAAGSGAYVAAIFLMLTHAFYKALLFLGAGSVIHAMNDEQDIKTMGGLAKLMPLTAGTFLVGWLAIAGVPPFSGFWSKSEVLESAWRLSPALWAIGALTAVLTAYYMGREYFLVFLGQRRWEEGRRSGDGHQHATAFAGAPGGSPAALDPAAQTHGHGAGVDPGAIGARSTEESGTEPGHTDEPLHPHDPGWVMSFPLVVLAVLAIFGGFIDLPFHPNFVLLEKWLDPVFGHTLLQTHYSLGEAWAFAIVDAALAITGVLVAAALWRNRWQRPALEPRFLSMAWFIDWSYDRFIARPSEAFAAFSAT